MGDVRRKSSGGVIRVGISGWTYKPWRGTFYPKKLAQKNELPYASAMLPSIEINGTFYGLQKPTSYAAWHAQTPAEFVFSVKAPRFITHMKRLRDVEAPIANFFVSGVLRLNEKLGPILWQFPPNFHFKPDLFEAFLEQLPRSNTEAAKLLKRADDRMKGRSWAKIDSDRPMRHAVEIRHESFATESFVRLLRKHNVALVTADTAGKWPMLHDVTADFVYLRLHGEEELYASGYTEKSLEDWATKIRALSKGTDAPGGNRVGPAAQKRAKRDVYVYFDNDVKVRSPFDAARLAMKLGLRERPLEEAQTIESSEVPREQWPSV
ncbi:MAG: DUF72 domain-containing protein [Burkholderiales bacterium]|nr:DUF72 domain-containing protein [Phycisphaerae bacterium]